MTGDSGPLYYDTCDDRGNLGDLWCPCGEHLWDEGWGWPLDEADSFTHLCPFCTIKNAGVPVPARYDEKLCGKGDHTVEDARLYVLQRTPVYPFSDDRRAPGEWELLGRAVAQRLPAGVLVSVDAWSGCDEPDWTDPVYVVAWNPCNDEDQGDSTEYHDAICDLGAAPFSAQVDYVVACLVDG